MSVQGAKKTTEEEWRVHQPILKKLWLDGRKKLSGKDGVMEFMETKYNFSASKWQYEKHFKDWEWNKNRKREDWEQLSAAIHERKRQGKETDVYIGGELQSRDKIRKEISRCRPSTHHHSIFASKPQLPKCISIRTPTSDKTVSLTMDLPFQIFENNIQLRIDQASRQNLSWPTFPARPSIISPRLTLYDRADDEDLNRSSNFGSIEDIETLERQPSLDASSTTHIVSDIETSDSSIVTALKLVVPKKMADEDIAGSSVTSLNTHVFPTSLHRQILFSLANNMAGLGVFSMKEIIYFLQKETGENLYQLVVSDRSYSSRVIVQNLFKAAIEAGNARLVDVLLREKPEDVKINEQSCSVKGIKYTPIERAAYLNHVDVVQSLLNHSADVNRTYLDVNRTYSDVNRKYVGKEYRRGALDYAVSKDHDGKFNARIVWMLLKAGSSVTRKAMLSLIRSEEGEFIVFFMSANAGRYAAKWNEWGIFHEAIDLLENDISVEVIRVMLRYGVDLNYEFELDLDIDTERIGRHIYSNRTNRWRVIDIAAKNGKIRAVKLLVDSGAFLTGDTLPLAVVSGNQDLILLLLTRGADINSIGRLGMTPLAAAIRSQDAQVLRLIEERGASAKLRGEWHFRAALYAASEVGNVQYIEDLIRCRDQVSPEDLGHALVIAIRHGYHEDARSLIDAGANVNVTDVFEKRLPLLEALKQQKEALVLSLLDADADPNHREFDDMPHFGSINLAAEWGNRSVIENLIFAGADINTGALVAAVRRQDRELVHLLLDLGADVSRRIKFSGESFFAYCTSLEAAIDNGDIDMARFLLDQGANPNDEQALEKAIAKDEMLVDLLFERYNARYHIARGDFGAHVLAKAAVDGNEALIRQLLRRRVNAKIMMSIKNQRATSFGFAIASQQNNLNGCLELFLQNGCSPNDVVAEACWSDFGVFPKRVSRYFPPPRVTALLAAIGTGNITTVELFLRHGADVNFPTRGRIKRTPLQRAAEVGSLNICELLINHGANVNAPAAERSGGTALQLAAIQGYIPIVCKLLSLKADPNAPASKVNGRTALEGAAEHGRLDMVRVLLNGGVASRSGGEAQIESAITLAKDNEHFPLYDLLNDHLSSRRQDGDLTNFSLDDDPFPLVNLETDLNFDDDPFQTINSEGADDSNADLTTFTLDDDPFPLVNLEGAE